MNNTLAFLKFGKKEHLESFQKGKLHLYSLEHYKKLEDKEKNSYIGDRNEGVLIYNNCNVIIEALDGTGSFNIPQCTNKIESKTIDRMPILCMSSLIIDDLETINEEINKYKINFSEEFKSEFYHDEWKYVMIIDTKKFLDKIVDYTVKNNVYFKANYVTYDDFSVNYIERSEMISKDFKNVAFYKDLKYKNQREYRVSFNSLQIDEDEAMVIDIGDMTDFTSIMERDRFFNDTCISITPKEAENIN